MLKSVQMRKMVHNLLNQNVADKYVPYQMLENKQMLNDLLDTPDDFLEHIRRYSNALTTSMVFGWRTPTYADAKMQQLFDGFSKFADINQTGAAALIDFFPLLRWLPDWVLKTQQHAKDLHREEKRLYLGHWMKAKEGIKAGTISHCFCVGMAEAQEKDQFSDAQAVRSRCSCVVPNVILTQLDQAYISGTLLEAGSDTTSSTLYAFVQAMLLYPEVQRYAQQHIDGVTGSSRMPTMDDEAALPYVRSLVKETLSRCCQYPFHRYHLS
jgi:cytochrome P450